MRVRRPRRSRAPAAAGARPADPRRRRVPDFAERLLRWFDQRGRHDLPWRKQSAYAVWVSEVMLQQTQVATVLPYYRRFLARFPDVAALAAAPIDEVLHHWSGLGYYARARNLKRAAELIVANHGGQLPDNTEALERLPGIGRSTAAAIRALSAGERHAILDGNVKRVLARMFAVRGYAGEPAVAARLWKLSEALTPGARVADYTQAMMDLGATVCTRGKPRCGECPLSHGCLALARGWVEELPAPRPKRARSRRAVCMLLLSCQGRVLLKRRPPSGVWGGLWGLPEFARPDAAQAWLASRAADAPALASGTPLRHGFTHFDLEITPLRARLEGFSAPMEPDQWLWYNPDTPARLGLAAPVATLIRTCLDEAQARIGR